jgi:hypothetical protein
VWAAVAQTHAVLALAAATAVGTSSLDSHAWVDVVGTRLWFLIQLVVASTLPGVRADSGRTPGRPGWLLIKPPTRLYIAVDPEGKYFAPTKVPRTRTAILNEIKAVLKAQGVTRPNPTELDELVTIRTWSERCYEYAHFSDEELADGIMAVHTTINGLTREQLIEAIKTERDRGKDIKEVWSQWEHQAGKPELAHAL